MKKDINKIMREAQEAYDKHKQPAKKMKLEMKLDLHQLKVEVNQLACKNGFWLVDDWSSHPAKIALMHSELSEALEAHRHGNPPDEHCPEFSSVEIEMADVVIRVLDYCYHHGYRIEEAILAKHAYNLNRPYKHGKEG